MKIEKKNIKVDKYTVVLLLRGFFPLRAMKKRADWLIREAVFTERGLFGGIFYLIGLGLWYCDLHFTAHLLSPRSMLPFESLNGGGHFKIGKLCVKK